MEHPEDIPSWLQKQRQQRSEKSRPRRLRLPSSLIAVLVLLAAGWGYVEFVASDAQRREIRNQLLTGIRKAELPQEMEAMLLRGTRDYFDEPQQLSIRQQSLQKATGAAAASPRQTDFNDQNYQPRPAQNSFNGATYSGQQPADSEAP